MQVALPFNHSLERYAVGIAALVLTGVTVVSLDTVAAGHIQPSLVLESRKYADPASLHPPLQLSRESLGMNSPSPVDERLYEEQIYEEPIYVRKPPKEVQSNIVAGAYQWLGVPYLYGGESRAGIDCSALVQLVYAQQGIELYRTSWEQFRQGVGIPKANLLPGDLVFFSTSGPGASHVGIYIGDGSFISATRGQVEIQSLDDPYWAGSYRGSRRIIFWT